MNIISFFSYVFILWISISQWVSAQNLIPGDLEVGSGEGQIGLIMALNEECRGPATISPTSEGKLAVLDRVNGKIVVLGGSKTKDIPLPEDLLEPTDFIATTRGYLVVNALGEVILVSSEGTVIMRTKTEYDPESGSPRLISLSDGSFVLENLKGKHVPINLDSSQIGSLIVPGLSLAGDYTISPISESELNLASKRMHGTLATITVKSEFRITSARTIWVEEGKSALIAVQESRRFPVESAFVRLINIDGEGKPTTETYLSPETFSCDTVRPYARLTDGRVVSLTFHENNRLVLNILTFKSLGTSKPIEVDKSSDALLITSQENILKTLEQINGTSDAGEISIHSISRETILMRAKKALELKWLLTPSAYGQQGIQNLCNPPDNIWKRAKLLDGQLGTQRTGIPYAWGGYLKDLDTFNKQIDNNFLASNVCTCRNANCVNKKATGMDCSGFVSYAWRTEKYFTTASLPNSNISSPIEWSELTPGDIVNKRSNHVRLVESVSASTNGNIVTVIESSTRASCGGVCRRSYSQLELENQGYKPLRRVSLSD